MKIGRFFSLLLCISVLCTIVFCGCQAKPKDSGSSTKDEASSTEASVLVTDAPTDTHSTPPAKTEAPKETTAQKETKPKDNPSGNSSDQSSGNSGSGSSGSGNQKPMTCTVTVADKDYSYKLGDKFTYTYYLKTPDKIEDIQAKLLYTGGCLKLLSTEDEDIFPVIGEDVVVNAENPGVIKYNAINIKGMDFTKEASLITLTFEVVFGGNASIANTIEFMTETGGKPYVELMKFAEGIKTRETIG